MLYSIVILVLFSIIFIIISKYIIDKSFKYKLIFEDVSREYNLFALSIITKSILDRLINSQKDSTGSSVALREMSVQSEPFFNGLVVMVIGNMSNVLKDKFYTFYKKTNNNSSLILETSAIIESYSVNLLQRLKKFELDVKNANKIAVSASSKPVDVQDFVYGMLIESVVNDINSIKKFKI